MMHRLLHFKKKKEKEEMESKLQTLQLGGIGNNDDEEEERNINDDGRINYDDDDYDHTGRSTDDSIVVDSLEECNDYGKGDRVGGGTKKEKFVRMMMKKKNEDNKRLNHNHVGYNNNNMVKDSVRGVQVAELGQLWYGSVTRHGSERWIFGLGNQKEVGQQMSQAAEKKVVLPSDDIIQVKNEQNKGYKKEAPHEFMRRIQHQQRGAAAIMMYPNDIKSGLQFSGSVVNRLGSGNVSSKS
jgi:hypothetical protein